MRKLLLSVALAALCGCAATPTKQPDATVKVIGDVPATSTFAPHAIARKHQQREDRRVALEEGTKVEGGTVIR